MDEIELRLETTALTVRWLRSAVLVAGALFTTQRAGSGER